MPVVGNTHDLQNGRHDAARWFMETVGKINSRVQSGHTSQGFYVIAADGTAYEFNNNRNVERVLAVLDKGLQQFLAKPPPKVEIAESSDGQLIPPQGTTILRVYSRIRPVPEGCNDSNENVQRDHFWMLPVEAAALGDLQVPASLVNRLCRFAFVDAIRGEPDFWKPSEVQPASFKVERLDSNRVRLTGSFKMATPDSKRGIEGSLEAEIGIKGGKITQFEGFAEATAWGAGTYTPNPPAGKFPIKFAFVLAPKSPTTVAPQAAMFGAEYLGLVPVGGSKRLK